MDGYEIIEVSPMKMFLDAYYASHPGVEERLELFRIMPVYIRLEYDGQPINQPTTEHEVNGMIIL